MMMNPHTMDMMEWSQTVDLLERARDGDATATNHLFARYGERLRTVVRLRLGARLRSKLESTDVVQEALIASLPHIKKAEFDSSAGFFHWLTRLVENRIRDMADHFVAQRRDVDREQPLEVCQVTADSFFGPITELAAGQTPSKDVARAEDLERLEAAVDRLPEDQREALLLARYEGLPLAEAGEKMNRSPDAVRMLVARAIVRLGKELSTDTIH